MYKFVAIALLATVLAVSGAGCARNDIQQRSYEMERSFNQNALLTREAEIPTDKAVNKRVQEALGKLDAVVNAAVFAHNQDVLVGIEASSRADKEALENSVRESLHESMPGYLIHLTASSSLYQRIERMHSQLERGNAVPNADIAVLIHDIEEAAG